MLNNSLGGKVNYAKIILCMNVGILVLILLSFSMSTYAQSIDDATNLQIGKTYRLSKKTPLMPVRNPINPMDAMKKIKYLGIGGLIEIIDVDKSSNYPWYNIRTKDATTGKIYTGWINSSALMGQSLEIVNSR